MTCAAANGWARGLSDSSACAITRLQRNARRGWRAILGPEAYIADENLAITAVRRARCGFARRCGMTWRYGQKGDESPGSTHRGQYAFRSNQCSIRIR